MSSVEARRSARRAACAACDPMASEVTADQAVERPGCRVELTWMGDHFEGGTLGEECLSDFQGATYATSEVTATADSIDSWDRGWDANDQQVWGATAGAYHFDRRTPLPER